jgi:fibronectin type 3 domain-containing protein
VARSRPAALCGLAISLAGCAAWVGSLESALEREPPLVFDRPADLLPPDGLHVVSSADRRISLAWEPVLVGDVAGYAILRAPREGGEFALVGRTASRFRTLFTDAADAEGGLGDGRAYYYRVHPFDSERRVSRSHAFVSTATDPPPSPPAGLETYSNLPRHVVLRWRPSPEPGVTGYAVYRSPSAAGPWELVTQTAGRLETIYEDPIPGDLRVMHYRLRALNRFGGESEMGEPVRAVTKAEPLPPVGLREAERRLGELVVEWDPNVERDVTRYEVHRASFRGGGWTADALVGEVAVPRVRFRDAAVGCGERVRYRVVARDADRLVSERSRPIELVGEDIGLDAAGGPGRLELRWRGDLAAAGWTGARIVERHALGPDRTLAEIRGASSFALEGLPPGSHRLAVTLTRDPTDVASGSPSEAPACPVEVEIPE